MTTPPRRTAATTAIHAGRLPVLPGVPVIPPVHRSVIHEFVDADEFAAVMGDSSLGYLYGRIRNPSTDELAAVVAALEGAPAGLCFASGMGALSAAVAELAPPGAGLVAATQIYGQTHRMASARPDGRLVEPADLDALREAVAGAALVVCETVSNPSLAVADIPAVAEIAHAAGARLVVDNTIATPLNCRPLEHGADLVVHSATKYLNGHSDVLA
ncbi:MAG: aminotransferase class I/II-fold pyridoxal phosphate-dependent enzyme, partial [Gaiellales bacterium]